MTELDFKASVEGIKTEVLGRFDAMQKVLDDINVDREKWKKHGDALIAKGADSEEVKTLVERALKRLDAVESIVKTPTGIVRKPEQEPVSKRLVENEKFKEYAGRGWHKGGVGIQVDSIFAGTDLELKTTIDSTAVGSSTPGILVPQRLEGVWGPGVRKLRVRDLLPRRPTSNNAVDWVKTNTLTHAASPVAETSPKGESAYTYVIDSSPVRTIAHWIPATRQVLDDWQVLRAEIDFELLKGLADIEDNELLNGSGSGQHISGLTVESTTYNTALNVAGDTRIDKLNHAMLQLELLERSTTMIVLNPNDWRSMSLIKTEEGGANKGMYVLGGPAGTTTPTIWGVPIAVTTAMTSGYFLVGDATGAIVYDRMQARIDVSTEHGDFFIQNMVAIRAEERLALVVKRSDYFVFGAF